MRFVLNFTNEGGLERRFRFLKNIMGMWPIQRICEETKISDFGALVHDASDIEPWGYIIDVNDQEFLNPASMTQALPKLLPRVKSTRPKLDCTACTLHLRQPRTLLQEREGSA